VTERLETYRLVTSAMGNLRIGYAAVRWCFRVFGHFVAEVATAALSTSFYTRINSPESTVPDGEILCGLEFTLLVSVGFLAIEAVGKAWS